MLGLHFSQHKNRMFQSQLKVTNRFISTTAWCKRLGRPARRCSAVSGCFSLGTRWSRSCRGSPKIRGPDPEHQKWILSSLLYVRWSNLAHRTAFQYLPTLNVNKNICSPWTCTSWWQTPACCWSWRSPAPGPTTPPALGLCKKYLEDISNINLSIQHVKIATRFYCKKHFQGILPASCKKNTFPALSAVPPVLDFQGIVYLWWVSLNHNN